MEAIDILRFISIVMDTYTHTVQQILYIYIQSIDSLSFPNEEFFRRAVRTNFVDSTLTCTNFNLRGMMTTV